MVEPFQYHGLLNRQSECCFQELVDPLVVVSRCLYLLGKGDFRSGGSSNTGTRFSKLFGIVLLCRSSIVVRMVPVTAPRQARNILLETLLGCASSPFLHVETHVVRTAASLRMTAVAEFCHCVHTKCSTRSGLVGWWRMQQTCLVCVCTRDILVRVLVFLVLQLMNDKIISVKWQSVSAKHRIPIENTTAMVDRRTSRPSTTTSPESQSCSSGGMYPGPTTAQLLDELHGDVHRD